MRDLTEEGCTAFGKVWGGRRRRSKSGSDRSQADYLAQVFHKECFRCHGCKKKLDGKFHSKDDQPYCTKCYKVDGQDLEEE